MLEADESDGAASRLLPTATLADNHLRTEATSSAVDQLLAETTEYQDKVIAQRRAEEEAAAAAAAAAAGGRSHRSAFEAPATRPIVDDGPTFAERSPEETKLSPADEAKRKADLLKVCSCPFASDRLRTDALTLAPPQQYGYLEEETEADRLAREEAERAPDKALKDPSQMSKKQRKKALEGVGALESPLWAS